MAIPARVPLDGGSFFGARATAAPRRATVATFGGTPTVPATAEDVEPDDIVRNAPRMQSMAADTNTGLDDAPPPPPPAASQSGMPAGYEDYALPTPHATNTKNPDGSFRAVNGWDPTKLNDISHNTAKYAFMRAVQNAGVEGGGLGERGNRDAMAADMPRIVQDLQYAGFPQATLVGDDKIDFGDGYGPVDVLTGNGEWWWGTQDQIAGTNAAGAASNHGGSAGSGIPEWIRTLFGGTSTGGVEGPGGGGDIDAAIAGLLGGETPFGHEIGHSLQDIIQHGGLTPDITRSLVTAREQAALAEQGTMADARGRLAESGGLSTPGVEQGSTNAAIERTAQSVAQPFAQAVSGIEQHALDTQNESFMGALQMATGMSRDQAQTALGAIGAGTNRQAVIGDLALRQLATDQDWNKFVAQHGLDVARLQEDITNGRMDRLIALLHEFLSGAGAAGGGHV